MRPVSLKSWRLSFPQMLLLGVFVGVLIRSTHQTLRDPDTYMHLTAGQWILTHLQLPTTDPFSFTKFDQPWMIHEWLSEVILQVVYQYGGWGGLVTLAALMFGLTLAYLYRFLLDRTIPIYALVLCALAFYGLGTHLLVRPHLLTWPILAIWAGQLIQASEQNRAPSFWLLPLVTLWANLHGGFILGIALIVPFAIESVWINKCTHKYRWLSFLLLAIGSSMLTPLGWKGWWLSAHLMSLSSLSTIGEWAPPGFNTLNPIELWLILIIALGLLGKMRLSPIRLVMVLLLLHQSLAHGRYISIFSLIVPMLIVSSIASEAYANAKNLRTSWLDVLLAKTTYRPQPIATGLSIIALCLTGIFFIQTKTYAPAVSITPAAAVTAIESAGIKGHVLNFYNFGAYLIHRGIPVYIDGRADLYGDQHITAYQAATDLSDPEKTEALLKQQNIAWTIFPPGESINAYLSRHPAWKKLYQDQNAIVYVRNETGQP